MKVRTKMQFGIDIPNSGVYSDPGLIAELAHEVEDSGWDGLFTWDHLAYCPFYTGADAGPDSGEVRRGAPIADPWVSLAAAACRTDRIRIGTMVTPVPRRRPWKLARETVSLDRLSNGRLILGVGMGDPRDVEYENFGEDGDPRVRAKKLDEGLDVLAGLWSGEPFDYEGEYYRVKDAVFLPQPVQSPRIPIWVGGVWPRKAPFRRAARWDGVYPIKADGPLDPRDVSAIASYISSQRASDTPYDIAVAGDITGGDPVKTGDITAEYAEAGATWLVQGLARVGPLEEARRRIHRGPPRL